MTDEALVVVDMVNDFVTGALRCERADRIIPNIQKLLEAARRGGVPVFYVNDAHLPSDPELRVWGPHSMAGTRGADVIPALKPAKTDFVLPKRTYSAFYETGLDDILRNMDVERVVIAGLHTNICDRHTTADAFFRGYVPVIPTDGVEAMDQKAHDEGLEYLKTTYATDLTTTHELANKWKERRPSH